MPGLLSPKERNLYTKIFSGYLFNEFIHTPSLAMRFESFLNLKPQYLNKKINVLPLLEIINNEIINDDNINYSALSQAHVNFDNHIIRRNNKEEPAEYSDIAIWLPKKSGLNHLISIEAKYTQNWSITNDIDNNMARIRKILKKRDTNPNYNTSSATFILLLSDLKITEQLKNKHSILNQYLSPDKSKESSDSSISVCILSWEQIIAMINKIAPSEDSEIISKFYSASVEQMRNQGRFRKR